MNSDPGYSEPEDDEPSQLRSWPFVLGRVSALFALLMGFSGLVYLAFMLAGHKSDAEMTISISFLFVLPACLGAVGALIGDIRGDNRDSLGFYFLVPTLLVGGVALLGVAIFQEGIICLLLLSPLWWVAALGGAFAVRHFQRAFASRVRLNCSLLILLPFAALALERTQPVPVDAFTVSRSIEIAAEPETVWPHLLRMETIADSEGGWNVTQDLLRVPRPRAAVVSGTGPGAIRSAQWGEDVTFEEHLRDWTPGEAMTWTFVFPNDSVRRHTDAHIAPDGRHLSIDEGGYRLTRLADGGTRLDLHTRFRIQTPVNAYASMWSELMLGDIQTNVLHIIRDRAEGRVITSETRETGD